MDNRHTEIIEWLTDIREHVQSTAPSLIPTFETYMAEAIFGRQYIASDLSKLPNGASILEVGAGSLLLSCQPTREGYDVSALEPIGAGFSHFHKLRQLVLDRANTLGCQPRLIDQTAETLSEKDNFDYALSINVIEHIQDIELSLVNICASIKAGAIHRFTCPNYIFPCEPHFNIPTFFSKRLTEKLLNKKIYQSKIVPDIIGTWASLNWINPFIIAKGVKELTNIRVSFNRGLLVPTLERIATDANFAQRRSPLMRSFILGIVHLKLHKLLALVPVVFQPITDCSL